MTISEFIWGILIPSIGIGLLGGFAIIVIISKLFSQHKNQSILKDVKQALFGNI